MLCQNDGGDDDAAHSEGTDGNDKNAEEKKTKEGSNDPAAVGADGDPDGEKDKDAGQIPDHIAVRQRERSTPKEVAMAFPP